MTETKYNRLVTRIFWFALPLVIALLTYLVLSTFAVQTKVETSAAKYDQGLQLQEKMWVMLQENNGILKEKADKVENETAHKIMFQKLDELNSKVDIITRRQIKYMGFNAIPYKELPMVSVDTAKNSDLTYFDAKNNKMK